MDRERQELADVGAMNDGDEFVWEEEAPPPSDHTSSHHYWLDMAALRAKQQTNEHARTYYARRRLRARAVEPPEAA